MREFAMRSVRKFGQGKRRFGLNRVMAKLDNTPGTVIAITFLVMNLATWWRRVFCVFLCCGFLVSFFCCFVFCFFFLFVFFCCFCFFFFVFVCVWLFFGLWLDFS